MIVFDLDGTLTLCEHRAHFIAGPKETRDWDGWHAACGDDLPNWPIIKTLLALSWYTVPFGLEIWTGRSEEVRAQTLDWLARYNIAFARLKMRPIGDHRADTVLKKEWLDQAREPITLVFEDRARMVAMWRENGITCCQVAPGNF